MAEKRNPTRVEKTSEEIIRFIIDNKMLPGNQLPTEEEFLTWLEVSRGNARGHQGARCEEYFRNTAGCGDVYIA